MPLLNNESLDDPILSDGCASFEGGQVSAYRGTSLQANQFKLGQNIEIDLNAKIMTRIGIEGTSLDCAGTYVNGLAYLDTPLLERMIAFCGGTVKVSNDGNSFTATSGYTPSGSVVATQLIDKLYFTDGVGRLTQWDGSNFTSITDLPVGVRHVMTHTNALFVTGSDTLNDTIYRSDLLDGTNFDTTKWSLRIGGGDGEPILGCVPWYQYWFAVFKSKSISAVNADPLGTSAADWEVSPVSKKIGCAEIKTAVQVGTDIMFLDYDGVHSLSRTLSEDQYGVSDSLSNPIQDWIDRINWTYISTARAAYWKNRYILAVPIDAATSPSHCLVWNTYTKSWQGVWTGWQVREFCVSRFSSLPKLHFGDDNDYVNTFLDYKTSAQITSADYDDNGTDIETRLRTRGMNFGDPMNDKFGEHVECSFNYLEESGDSTSVYAQINDANSGEIVFTGSVITGLNTLPIDLPFDLDVYRTRRVRSNLMNIGTFRDLDIEIVCTSGRLSIASIHLASFLDFMQLEGQE